MKKIKKKYHLRENIKNVLLIAFLLSIATIAIFWVEYRLPQLEKNEIGVEYYGK